MLSTGVYFTLLSLVLRCHIPDIKIVPTASHCPLRRALRWCGVGVDHWSLVHLIVVKLHRVMDLKLLLGTRTLVTALLVCSTVWNGISLNAWFNVIRIRLPQLNRSTGTSSLKMSTTPPLLNIAYYRAVLQYHVLSAVLLSEVDCLSVTLRYCGRIVSVTSKVITLVISLVFALRSPKISDLVHGS